MTHPPSEGILKMHDAEALHDSLRFDLRDPPKCLLEVWKSCSECHALDVYACDPFGVVLFLVIAE